MTAVKLHSSAGPQRRERGVAALGITMLLLFALILALAFVNRNLIFEQRASVNQYRSTQAFEAAEAGLEWALARFNDNQRIGADCLPSADPAATSFRERYLGYDNATATYSATTWNDGGVATALLPTCVRADGGWTCSCPSSSAPDLAAPAGTSPAPAFSVRFQSTGRPGIVRAIAVGCTSLGGACTPGGAATTDASAQVQVLFGLLAGLRTAPAAPLTVRGAVRADAAAFGAHNRDAASGGLAIHAGGSVDAALAHLTLPAGAATADGVARDDNALAAQSPTQFFAGFFGIDPSGWASQPVVRRLSCSGDCTAALLAAIELDAGPSLVHVSGDLSIRGPATLGTAARPVVVVAGGAVQIDGAVIVNGILYGDALTWSGIAGPGALVRGALLAAGDYQGDGTPEIAYDAAVMAILKGASGTFARVNGSWRDF